MRVDFTGKKKENVCMLYISCLKNIKKEKDKQNEMKMKKRKKKQTQGYFIKRVHDEYINSCTRVRVR